MPDAITPYNFVPLPKAVVPGNSVPAADRYYAVPPDQQPGMDAPRHTGWFSLRLTTKTPTYTRAAQKVAGDDTYPTPLDIHNEQPADFFHRGDKDAQGNFVRTPILPGCSLRGMIRSVFEIMACSYPEFINNRRLFYRSFAEAKGGLGDLYRNNFIYDRLVGGQLRRDEKGWYLNVSKKTRTGFVAVKAVTDPSLYTTEKVWVQISVEPITLCGDQLPLKRASFCDENDSNAVEGRLIFPGADIRGHVRNWHQVVLTPVSEELISFDLDDQVYNDYVDWGAMAHGSRFGSDDYPPKAPRKLDENSYCFALLNNDETKAEVIGANMMMALRYSQSLREVAGKEVGYRPRLDMTEALFGRVDEKRPKVTIKGRVFFEDAVCRTSSPWLSENVAKSIKVPDILSGPKPTSVQTYLKQEDGQPLRHWSDDGSDGGPQAEIRGVKRYWHRSSEAAGKTLNNTLDDANKSRQQTKMRPVRENVVFTTRVRFENLTDAELGGLYAAIQLPQNLAHKFGMAKNLGLGSLKVEVTETTLLDIAERYRSFSANAGKRSNALGAMDVDRQFVDDTLRCAYSQFVSWVHAVCPNKGSLWGSERMQALAALLTFEPQLPVSETRQVEIKTKDNEIQRDAHNDDQWGSRNNRLPTARQLADRNRLPMIPTDILPVTLMEVVLPDKAPDASLQTEASADEPNRAEFFNGENAASSNSSITSLPSLFGETSEEVERDPPSAEEVAALPYQVGDEVVVKVLTAQFQKGTVKVLARYVDDFPKPIPFKNGPELNDVPIKGAEPGNKIRMVVTNVHKGTLRGLKRP